MRIKPKKNFVLLEQVTPETVSGLHLPESARRSFTEWIVRDYGDEAREDIHTGMSVVLNHGNTIPVGDNLILAEDEMVIAEKFRDEE